MKRFYSELSYVCGLVFLAAGASMMTKADFGLSMVIAPAYLIHLKLSETWAFVTFGMAEYMFQALLLLVMLPIVRRFKATYLLSFLTAVLYGFVLDGFLAVWSLLGEIGIAVRIIFYVVGLFFTSLGVAFMFHTYLSAEVYELFVKELSQKYGLNISRCKTVYDCISCVVAVIMSFCFFGMWHFEGIGWGTAVCALLNGWLIGRISKFLDSRFEFADRFSLRKYF